MVPGTDLRSHRRLHIVEDIDDVVAIAVEQRADGVDRNLHRIVGRVERAAVAPKVAVALMAKISEEPRLRVEAVPKIGGIDLVIRGAGHEIRRLHLLGEDVEVQRPIDIVHVVVVKVLAAMQDEDCLQRRRIAHGHHQGVEGAPGDALHADLAVAPGEACDFRDHLLEIVELRIPEDSRVVGRPIRELARFEGDPGLDVVLLA